MGRRITFSDATLEAMNEEMERDDTIYLLGEDIAMQGGIFGQFKNLSSKFPGRVLDTPISETAIVGVGVGSSIAGMRPVIDMHFADFLTVAMDEVVNQMAKIRYMFGGQTDLPLVVRAPDGIIHSAGAQHSQSLEAWFMHVPGLKVVVPSNAADAKGMLKAAIRDQDPVMFFEHKALFKQKGEVPEGEHIVPIGKANIVKEGSDVTLISYSNIMNTVIEAEKLLAEEGISAEILDLRSISPLDKETIYNSVAKTHRAVIVHEAIRVGGVGAEVSALINEDIFDELDSPVLRLGAPFTPVPFTPALEKYLLPGPKDIVKKVKGLF